MELVGARDNMRGDKSGGGRGQVGPKSVPSRGGKIGVSADVESNMPASDEKVSQNAHLDAEKLVTS